MWDQRQTGRVTKTTTLCSRAHITHAKINVEDQRFKSYSGNKRTDTTDFITCPATSVGNRIRTVHTTESSVVDFVVSRRPLKFICWSFCVELKQNIHCNLRFS